MGYWKCAVMLHRDRFGSGGLPTMPNHSRFGSASGTTAGASWSCGRIVSKFGWLALACAALVATAGCGKPQVAAVGSSSGPGTCVPTQLTLGSTLLGEGMGHHYYLSTVTNTSPMACSLPQGQPTFQRTGPNGKSITNFVVSALRPAAAPSPPTSLNLAPGGKVYFVRDEQPEACPVVPTPNQTSGTFTDEVVLPGLTGAISAVETAGPAYVCSSEKIAISELSASDPANLYVTPYTGPTYSTFPPVSLPSPAASP
jgi:hypothetical protein